MVHQGPGDCNPLDLGRPILPCLAVKMALIANPPVTNWATTLPVV